MPEKFLISCFELTTVAIAMPATRMLRATTMIRVFFNIFTSFRFGFQAANMDAIRMPSKSKPLYLSEPLDFPVKQAQRQQGCPSGRCVKKNLMCAMPHAFPGSPSSRNSRADEQR
jgi:hypothetical protein